MEHLSRELNVLFWNCSSAKSTCALFYFDFNPRSRGFLRPLPSSPRHNFLLLERERARPDNQIISGACLTFKHAHLLSERGRKTDLLLLTGDDKEKNNTRRLK